MRFATMGLHRRSLPAFWTKNDFLAAVAGWARNLRFDRQAGQPRRLALWCEAAGMVPQLERVAAAFAPLDPQHHAFGVNVGDLQRDNLHGPQAGP